MGKCDACREGKCDGRYSRRYRCDSPSSCSCTCQEDEDDTFFKGFFSVLGGVAAVAGGVALTVATGGLAAAVGGAAIVGTGSSMVMNPIAKKMSGERMTGKDYAADVAIGAVTGAATGGIGAGGAAVSAGRSGLVKLGTRAGAGVISGVTGGAISETGRAVKGEEVDAKSFGKSLAFGAVCGGIGGASTHGASNLSKLPSSGVARAATRIGTQAAAGATVDAAVQKATTGKVDLGNVLVQAGGQAAIATTAEVGRYGAVRTGAYNKQQNKHRIKQEVKNKEEIKEVIKMIESANEISKKDLTEMKNNANDLEAFKSERKSLQLKQSNLKQELNSNQQLLKDTKSRGASSVELKNIQDRKSHLNKQLKNVNKLMKNEGPTKKLIAGKYNFHYLTGDRNGQAAMDFEISNNGHSSNRQTRNAERILLEKQSGNRRLIYSGKVNDHAYDDHGNSRLRGELSKTKPIQDKERLAVTQPLTMTEPHSELQRKLKKK